jgi:hypothetical protein
MKHAFVLPALTLFAGMGLAACLMSPPSSYAQSAEAASSAQPDSNQQLLQRINDLEAKVKQLEQKQSVPPAPIAVAPAPEAPAPVEMPTVNEVAPRLKLAIFGDVGAQGYNGSDTSFFFGSFDMFMTARLSNKVSVLGEVLFLPDITDNSIGVDIERLLLRYRHNDYFMASVGRYNTWVGYYNTAFNKGEFLETSTDRPFIYAFDDFGGVLPMQDLGVSITGKIPSGKLGLNYVVEAGNGRAWGTNVEPAQNRQDGNTSKSINGGLFMRPDKFSGLQLGFSARHDNLTIPGPAVHETIVTAHAVFTNSKYEILNEAVLDRHTLPIGPAFNTTGFYSQFSRAFRAYRPYFRYEYFNAPSNDPVYAYANQNDYAPANFSGFVGRLNGPSVGIRYDFNDHAALKFQYDRFSLRDLPSENGLTSQIAFTF